MAKKQAAFDSLVDRISKNDQTLQIVDLSQMDLTDAEIAQLTGALSTNTHVTVLDLSWIKLEESGAKLLAVALRGKKLTQLKLAFTSLGDAGIRELIPVISAMATLENFELAGNRYSEETLNMLIGALLVLPKLTSIDLHSTNLGDKLAKACSRLLQESKTLERLNVSGCRITPVGMKLLGENLHHCATLTYLDAWGNCQGYFFNESEYEVERLYTFPTVTRPATPPGPTLFDYISRYTMMCFGYEQIKPQHTQAKELTVTAQAPEERKPPKCHVRC